MVYLDNAATSWPKPESVWRAMDEFARRWAANPGRAAHRMALAAEERIALARERLARLLNAPDPSRLAFTLNCTDALNIAIKGLVRPGDHVVMGSTEHNSITRPLTRMEREGRITLSRLAPGPDRRLEPAALRALLSRPTRLVAVAHVSNVLGRVNPIVDLAREAHAAGALLLVDAAQSVGAVPIDVAGLDLVAFPGHKGLYGPMGTGALYVRPGLEPDFFREGGTGVRGESPLHTEEMPMRLEGGTPNAHGLAGLAEGLAWVLERTPEAIGAHERRLAALLAGELAKIPGVRLRTPEADLGLVGITLDGMAPAELAARLNERDIAARPGTHCAPGAHALLGTMPEGFLRFSIGAFTTEEEVGAVAAVMRDLAGP